MNVEGIAAYLNVQVVWQAVYLNVEGVAEHILTADESPFINTSLFKSNQITFKTINNSVCRNQNMLGGYY